MERHDSPGSTPRLVLRLLQQEGWTEPLPDAARQQIMQDCLADLRRPDLRQRDRNRLLDILLKMEAADVSRGRLLVDMQKSSDSDPVTGDELLRALEEAKNRSGRDAP